MSRTHFVYISTILIFGDKMNDLKLYENVPFIDNRFTVKFKRYDHVTELAPHWHEHIELLYVLSGEADFLVGGESYSVGEGELVVVNPSQIHTFRSRDVSYYCILIYPEFFFDILPITKRIECVIRDDDEIRELFYKIEREISEGMPHSDMMVKAYTYILITRLLREHTRAPLSDEELRREGIMRGRISDVCKYISENYMRDISTRELANLCYLTESHFCRLFKGAMGKTSVQYINSFRIERAGVLLRESSLAVSEIAEAVGFSELNYFSRMFKKIMGKTPLEYRKEFKK